MMKTIQMTIDDELLADVDRATQALQTNRSAFIRSALQRALQQHHIRLLEQQHAAGYHHKPGDPDEVDAWQNEQQWGEQ